MALGCPVACSHLSSLPEVAGDAALFFDPYSVEDIGRVILQALNDRGLREQVIERGLRRATLYSGDNCARATAEAINRVMSSDWKMST